MESYQEQFPAPREGLVLTHFITSRDIERSAAFYRDVLGGVIVSEDTPMRSVVTCGNPAATSSRSGN